MEEQNGVAGGGSQLVVAGVVLAVGLIPTLWHDAARDTWTTSRACDFIFASI